MSNSLVRLDSGSAAELEQEIKLNLLEEILEGQSTLLVHGYNRNSGMDTPCLIMANNDAQALMSWLEEYRDSPETFRAYAKEARRVLEFSKEFLGKPLSAWNRSDFQQYSAFLASPTPVSRWCGPPKPWSSPLWRPFRNGGLAPKSVAHAMTILSSAVDWLVSAGYLNTNPLKLSRLKTRKTRNQMDEGSGHTERVFNRNTYEAMLASLDCIDYGNRQPEKRKARLLFMFAFLFNLAPRISELSRAKMRDFRQDSRGNWFWQTIGKGAKRKELPLPDEFMAIFQDYRIALGLPTLPSPSEPYTCVQKISVAELSVTAVDASSVHRELKWALKQCAAALERIDPSVAEQLPRISAHWFRHSAITEFYDASNDIRLTADFARHNSINTTMLYSHTTSDQIREASNQRGKPKQK